MNILEFFTYPSLAGIGIAVAFGLFWLAVLRIWQWRGRWLWLGLAGVVLFPVSIAWIQIPLQSLVNNRLVDLIGPDTFKNWVFLTYIPYILLSGLVQEGAKLFPIAIYWWTNGRDINPKIGLAIGAIVGAGFGVCEAQWILNSVVTFYGFTELLAFWERFFTVLFHIGASAIAGYGLAKGKGWQFYLLAAGLHSLANYSTLFYASGMVSAVQIEIIIAAFAVIILGLGLWLQSRKEPVAVIPPPPSAGTPPAAPSASPPSL